MAKEPKVQDERVFILGAGSFKMSQGGRKPVPDDMPGVKGIFIGGCVAKGFGLLCKRFSDRNEAHAHTDPKSPFHNWVCFQLPENFEDEGLRLHELAHIRTGQGHTDAWRAEMRRLGQPIFPRYQARRRNPR